MYYRTVPLCTNAMPVEQQQPGPNKLYTLGRIYLSWIFDLTGPIPYCIIVQSFSSFLFSSALATLSEAALGSFRCRKLHNSQHVTHGARSYGQSLKALKLELHQSISPPKAPFWQSNTTQ